MDFSKHSFFLNQYRRGRLIDPGSLNMSDWPHQAFLCPCEVTHSCSPCIPQKTGKCLHTAGTGLFTAPENGWESH